MAACDPISEEQFEKMLRGCTGPYRLRDQCLMEFLGSTGYRISEALSVTIGQVWDGAKVKDDLQVSSEHMKKKTPRDRVILHPDCKQAILKWLTHLAHTFGRLDPTWKLQIPPDLVVTSQAIDITEINLSRIRRPNAVHTLCRNRISRLEQLSTSEAHWSTTKSDGM
jgi:site-specific recombinase XerD